MMCFALALSFAPVYAADAKPEPSGYEAVTYTWGLAYGGYVGGTTGYLVGETLEERESAHTAQGVLPGVLIGGGIGLTTGLLVTRKNAPTLADGVALWSGSSIGTFYGVQAGRALIPLDSDAGLERIHATGLAGSMAGTGVAFLTQAPDPAAMLHFDLATGIGAVAAGGASDAAGLTLPDNNQARAAINMSGAAIFGGTAAAYAALAEQNPNAGAWGLSVGHGAWLGGMAPYMFSDNPDTRQVLGGVRAGLGVGYMGALALASAGNPDGKSVALQSLGIAAGNALGAGVPLSMGEEGPMRLVVIPMLAGGVGGQIVGAAVAPHYALEDSDVFLIGTVGAWTGYQAAGWAAFATATDQQPTRALGYALTSGGSGTLLAMGLAPAVDVSASGSAMLLSGGGWGTWYGGWTAQILGDGIDTGWILMLTAGDAALLGTAIAQGAGWQPTWRDVAMLDGLGLLGSAGGGLVGVIALYDEDNWDPMVGSILAGTTIGLGVGSALIATERDSPAMSRSLPEIRLGQTSWTPMVSARPWMDDEGQPGIWAELSLYER